MASIPLSPADVSPLEMERIIDRALEEDLAGGDVTTRTIVPFQSTAFGDFNAREPMTVSGLAIAEAVFRRVDSRVAFEAFVQDGTRVAPKTRLAHVRGPGHSVLTGERVALNLLQHMCGVATKTRSFVDALPQGARTRVTDTRKTTPGLRSLERYAVRCGGGINHRNDLGAGVLIKDNHIVLCGGVRAAVERARANAPHTLRIEVEVDRMEYLEEAIDVRADVIMLDNFNDAMVEQAMKRVQSVTPRPLIEVSGGLTLERIAVLGSLGVDILSFGALTHSARRMDIGLDLTLTESA